MSLRTDLRDEIRQLEANGWTVTKTGGKHWRCTHPDVPSPIFTGGTPSDQRSVRNFRAKVKRALRSATIEERPMPTTEVIPTSGWTSQSTGPVPWQPEIRVYRTQMDSKPKAELTLGAREAAHLGGLGAKVSLIEGGVHGAWHLRPDPEGNYTLNKSGNTFRVQCTALAAVIPPTGRTEIPSELDGAGFTLFPGLVTPIAPNAVKQRARARATVDVWNKEYRFPGPPTARTHAAVEAPPSTEVQSSRQPSLDDLRAALEMLRTIVTDLGAELYLDDAGIVRARIVL